MIAAVALAYAGYLALLVTCDLRRVPALGFRADFAAGAMVVRSVTPDSIAAHAGLQVDDRIVRANTQLIEGRIDWQRVRVHLSRTRPLGLDVVRHGAAATVTLPVDRRDPIEPGLPPAGLLTFRLAQIVTLGFGILVGLRRPSQPSALLGALLLASLATVSLVLPMRLAEFWQQLPALPALVLWLPFATSVAVGPMLFAFFAVFPRRSLSPATIGALLLPGVVAVAWYVRVGVTILAPAGGATGLPDWTAWVFAVNISYAFGAVVVALTRSDLSSSVTDRRRARVLLVGTIVGVAAAAAAVARYWWDPWDDIFATRILTVLSLGVLAVPASFTYAILRHRLFDVSLIVRQGLRYALARRFVDAMIPALAGVLLLDVLVNREQSVGDLLRSRWWWFTVVGAALWIVRARREDWLRNLDRRFFRERYDAQRLLSSIAGQISRASSLDAIAPAVAQQIDEALHPQFVDVLTYVPRDRTFAPVAAGLREGPTVGPLPASLAVVGVLSVLRKPLALSLGDTAWVRHQLPGDERTLLLEHGIELLVPVSGLQAGAPPLALLVLGPRRSEEPYNPEDLQLLVTIAEALGLLIERSPRDRQALGECERCGRCFDDGTEVCPDDRGPLTTSRGSRLLNQRYRLERRLGRGGMGAVYAAVDEVLERPVAVKLIREDVAGPLNLDARFRQEARSAAGFAHPHVVRIYDFGVDTYRRPFLVMELLEGDTLRQRLAAGAPLGIDDTLLVLRGVCAALTAAHDNGLVHRDLKPENIFLQSHGAQTVPKVLDFGLAKAFARHGALAPIAPPGTSAGLLVGTLDYMAPEQVAGDEVQPAWDIWALAVIAYEMFTGGHPFHRTMVFAADPGSPDSETAVGVTPGAPAHPLPDRLTMFFSTALSTNRANRPADAAIFLRACEQALR